MHHFWPGKESFLSLTLHYLPLSVCVLSLLPYLPSSQHSPNYLHGTYRHTKEYLSDLAARSVSLLGIAILIQREKDQVSGLSCSQTQNDHRGTVPCN